MDASRKRQLETVSLDFEVARALGISRFSARRRISAALRMLEKELEEGDLDG